MIRNLALSALLCLAAAGASAQALIIEDFENFDDPGNWQLSQPNNPPNHTLNASVTGNVPLYVTSGTANMAGRFVVNWELDSPVSGENPYVPADGNLYYAARLNINAPSSLPNNAIPTDTGLLQADIVNESTYPVQVALVVTNAQVSQLERGPLVTVGGGESIVYSWDFATQAPIGFDTGDGVFSGNTQQVKSLLVYSSVAPPQPTLSLKVDNIRNGRGGEVPVTPRAPKPVSLTKGAGAGTAVFAWSAPANSEVTGYNVYVATDDDFGSVTHNRLSFPAVPTKVVAASEMSAELTELASDTNIYAAVAAVNGDEVSPLSQAFAIRLDAGGETQDRLVLDNDAFEPGQVDFALNGYAHAAVYTAQALGGLQRSFDTVAASSVASGAATLPAADESVVVWSNLLDGESGGPAISLANLNVIQNHIAAGGNIIISGTNAASSIVAADLSLETLLRASLSLQNVGLSSVSPVGHLSGVPTLSTVTNIFSDTAAYATTQNDAIRPVRGSVELAQYQSVPRSTGLSAGIGYRNRLVFLSFAFESVASEVSPIESANLRREFMDSMINYLLAPTAAADWQLFE